MKFHRRGVVTALFVAALGASAGANAALVSRLGGLAYYDTNLGITWLANANAAVGSAYDTFRPGSGLMNWASANAWLASLTVDGVSGWQLPTTGPVNGSSFDYFNFSYNGSTDTGFNISAPGSVYPGSTSSEMANLFYNTLGNKAYCDTTASCPQLGWGLTNTGPFSNVQDGRIWSACGSSNSTRAPSTARTLSTSTATRGLCAPAMSAPCRSRPRHGSSVRDCWDCWALPARGGDVDDSAI